MNHHYINYFFISIIIIFIVIYIKCIICKNNKAIKNIENMIVYSKKKFWTNNNKKKLRAKYIKCNLHNKLNSNNYTTIIKNTKYMPIISMDIPRTDFPPL